MRPRTGEPLCAASMMLPAAATNRQRTGHTENEWFAGSARFAFTWCRCDKRKPPRRSHTEKNSTPCRCVPVARPARYAIAARLELNPEHDLRDPHEPGLDGVLTEIVAGR